MASLTSDRRLYLDPDRERVVEHGDPDAAWLLASEGSVIGPDEVARYGLRMQGGKVVIPDVEPEEKMAEPPEDKMATEPENKATEPAEEPEAEPDEEWTLQTPPEEYLERFPDGPNAELARRILAGD